MSSARATALMPAPIDRFGVAWPRCSYLPNSNHAIVATPFGLIVAANPTRVDVTNRLASSVTVGATTAVMAAVELARTRQLTEVLVRSAPLTATRRTRCVPGRSALRRSGLEHRLNGRLSTEQDSLVPSPANQRIVAERWTEVSAGVESSRKEIGSSA